MSLNSEIALSAAIGLPGTKFESLPKFLVPYMEQDESVGDEVERLVEPSVSTDKTTEKE